MTFFQVSILVLLVFVMFCLGWICAGVEKIHQTLQNIDIQLRLLVWSRGDKERYLENRDDGGA